MLPLSVNRRGLGGLFSFLHTVPTQLRVTGTYLKQHELRLNKSAMFSKPSTLDWYYPYERCLQAYCAWRVFHFRRLRLPDLMFVLGCPPVRNPCNHAALSGASSFCRQCPSGKCSDYEAKSLVEGLIQAPKLPVGADTKRRQASREDWR